MRWFGRVAVLAVVSGLVSLLYLSWSFEEKLHLPTMVSGSPLPVVAATTGELGVQTLPDHSLSHAWKGGRESHPVVHSSAGSSRTGQDRKGRDRTGQDRTNMNILVLCNSEEGKDGGERISCTNYAQALKTYGHNVKFSIMNPRPALNGLHAVIIHGKSIKRDNRLLTSFRSENKGLVICVVKPHNVSLDLLGMADLVVVDSLFQSLAITRSGKLDNGQLVQLKLLEVPSQFWKGSSPLRPRAHEVFHGKFSLERPAVVCYHGNDDHLNEAEGVLDIALVHINQRTPLKFIAINRRQWTRGRPAGVQIKESEWSSMDDTYHTLRRCDIGLVPQLVGKPAGKTCGSIQPRVNVLSLTWKDSANAGRAFVFAQVGVPFVTGPDFETAKMLGDAFKVFFFKIGCL